MEAVPTRLTTFLRESQFSDTDDRVTDCAFALIFKVMRHVLFEHAKAIDDPPIL